MSCKISALLFLPIGFAWSQLDMEPDLIQSRKKVDVQDYLRCSHFPPRLLRDFRVFRVPPVATLNPVNPVNPVKNQPVPHHPLHEGV